MEFRFLGPVEVHAGGSVLPLEGPRQRAILAALALRANQVVTVDHLVEAVWESPPAVPASNVRSYIAAIRKLLDTAAGESHRLVAVRGGYLLETHEGELDLEYFDRLAQAGEQALRDEDFATAAELFRRASRLWRGRALEGVPLGPGLDVEARRLEERRLLVEERGVDARLAVGEHGELVSELRALVTEQPWREALWARLMFALYGCGRQADALAAYTEIRERLVEELGVEPGPELQQAQRQILAGDMVADTGRRDAVRSAATSGAADARDVRVPMELPPDVGTFTGRQVEVERLRTLLDEPSGGVVVAAVDGPGGVGKSALVLHVARSVGDRYPDGLLYVDLQGADTGVKPLGADEVLGRWLRAFGVPAGEVPPVTAEAAAKFRSLLSGKRVLMVLDNAADAAQVRPLLPGVAGCAALVTSRRLLSTLDNLTRFQLDVLSENDAATMLGWFAGPERVAREPETAADVAVACGRLPLALRVAGARLVAHPEWTMSDLARRLTDHRRRLDELQVSDLAVRGSFSVSYRDLRTDATGYEAARLFRLLGLLEIPDVGLEVVAAVGGTSVARVDAALERLLEAHLVESEAQGRFRLHDLLRLFAREQAEKEESATECDSAIRRAMASYISTAREASQLFDPASTDRFPRSGVSPASGASVRLVSLAGAVAWTDRERVNLVTLVRQGAVLSRVFADDVVQLVSALYRPFETRGFWKDFWMAGSLALEVSPFAGDPGTEARTKRDYGIVCGRFGKSAEEMTYLEGALHQFRELGDRMEEGKSLNWLGIANARNGATERAVACFEGSLSISQELGNSVGQGHVLNNLGLVYKGAGHYEPALRMFERALPLRRTTNDTNGLSSTLGNIADTSRLTGRAGQAVPYYREALALTRDVGNRYGFARNLWYLGYAHYDLSEENQAWACWRESLSVLRDLNVISPDAVEDLLSQPLPDTPTVILINA